MINIKHKILIPKFLQPHEVNNLIRLGKNNDGGYLVAIDDLKNSTNLVSLGVSFDISFERDFKRHVRSLKIKSYDGSVGYKYYKKNLKLRIKNLIKKPSISRINKFINRLVDFLSFIQFYSFTKNSMHVEKFINSGLEKDFQNNFYKFYGYEAEFISIEELFFDIDENSFFSIDIEGSEYGLFDFLINSQDKISGLVIELHDAHLNKSKIENFINSFGLKLIHLHINNYAKIYQGFPSVIELTFSKYAEFTNNKVMTLPNKLDQNNDASGPNYNIVFENKSV